MSDQDLLKRLRQTGQRVAVPCPEGIKGCAVFHFIVETEPTYAEAADRIEELKILLRVTNEIGSAYEEDAGQVRAKLAKAVAALRFYADVNNYDEGIVGTTHEAPVWSESDFTEFEWDNGDKARAVLAELEKTE